MESKRDRKRERKMNYKKPENKCKWRREIHFNPVAVILLTLNFGSAGFKRYNLFASQTFTESYKSTPLFF